MSDKPLFAELGFSKELYDIRQKNGTKLLVAAWIIEIAAALVGLIIALILFKTAIENQDTVNSAIESQRAVNFNVSETTLYLTALIGGLPFIMCSIVELMKIPIATLVYHSQSIIWKAIFFVALILLAIITFETMGTGMQQGYQVRTGEVQVLSQQILRDEDSISSTEAELEEARNIALTRQVYARQKQEVFDAFAIRRGELEDQINSQIDTARQSYGEGRTIGLQSQFDQASQSRELEETRYNQQISAINNEYEEDRAVLDSRYDAQTATYSEERASISQIYEAATEACSLRALTKGSCQESAEEARVASTLALDQKIAEEQDRYNNAANNLQRKRTDAISSLDNDLENSRSRLDSEISQLGQQLARATNVNATQLNEIIEALQNDKQVRIDELTAERDRQISEIAQEEETATVRATPENIEKLRSELEILREDLEENKSQLDIRTTQNQVYQMAKIAYSNCWFLDGDCDVSNQEVRMSNVPQSYVETIATYWFGSLAFIISTTGTLLAFGSMVLKYEHHNEHFGLRKNLKEFFTNILFNFLSFGIF